jgi:signal transduction histidine kinase
MLEDKLRQTMTRLDTTIQSVRRIATELRPAVLDTLGLNAAVEWQARDFESRSGIKCQLDASLEELSLDRETSTAVFRIVQESLTNIARHAEASEVRVTLRRNDGSLELKIHDNGRGIESNPRSRSLGILGMKERVNLLNGQMTVAGRNGAGTLVDVSIPLERGHDEANHYPPPEGKPIGVTP